MTNTSSRFNRLYREIHEDLTKILIIRELEQTNEDYIYYERQVRKYLKPHRPGELKRDLQALHGFFAPGPSIANWSYTGSEQWHGLFLYMAFGHSPRFGDRGDTIRISPKAFCLTDKVLAGVMLHEATHFLLGTVDHAYDNFAWIGHDRLKNLPDSDCYENADNWRIFYQKMREYIRS